MKIFRGIPPTEITTSHSSQGLSTKDGVEDAETEERNKVQDARDYDSVVARLFQGPLLDIGMGDRHKTYPKLNLAWTI